MKWDFRWTVSVLRGELKDSAWVALIFPSSAPSTVPGMPWILNKVSVPLLVVFFVCLLILRHLTEHRGAYHVSMAENTSGLGTRRPGLWAPLLRIRTEQKAAVEGCSFNQTLDFNTGSSSCSVSLGSHLTSLCFLFPPL